MTHCSDDDLILHYYGEDNAAASHSALHLQVCAACSDRYRDLASTLQPLTLEPPARGDHYGLEVWQRIRHRLPEREPWWRAMAQWQLAAVTVVGALLIVVGFTAGRLSREAAVTPAAPSIAAAADADVPRRVLLLSVADHLERSERVLTDIMNASGGIDISTEQQWAVDLVSASRLYRQHALDANEATVAEVLDQLERTLLDIVHRPSNASSADLDEIRRQIESAALLFKVRVMSTELRELTEAEQKPSSRAAGKIG